MTDVVIPSIRGGAVERYLPGDRYTATVGAGQVATGARLVEAMTGDRVVRLAQADSLVCVGVALHDAVAAAIVTVVTEGVWLLRAAGAIAAGQRVKCGALGVAVPIAADVDPRLAVGWAMADIVDTADGPVKLTL